MRCKYKINFVIDKFFFIFFENTWQKYVSTNKLFKNRTRIINKIDLPVYPENIGYLHAGKKFTSSVVSLYHHERIFIKVYKRFETRG